MSKLLKILIYSENSKNPTELNMHAVRGIMQAKLTYEYLRGYLRKRPLVISKSTYPGSGRYGGHWLGDDSSSWDDLKNSIPAMMNFHIFGIPFVGSNL